MRYGLALLLMCTSFVLAEAGGRGNCCPQSCCLGQGLMIGGYASFETIYFHSTDLLVQSTDERNRYQYDIVQRADGGGGYLGYGLAFCDCYRLMGQVEITGYSSKAIGSDAVGDQEDVYQNRLEMDYAVDLLFEPGVVLCDCLLLYARFGGSYAKLKQIYTTLDDDSPFPTILDRNKDDHYIWGYVVGVGSKVAICSCFNAFTEFNRRSYPGGLSPDEIGIGSVGDRIFYNVSRIFGNAFKIGLEFHF